MAAPFGRYTIADSDPGNPKLHAREDRTGHKTYSRDTAGSVPTIHRGRVMIQVPPSLFED
jgi:hypothetical protein